MDWKKLLGSITTSVDQELRLRNEYLATENRLLRQQITGRVHLTDRDRQALAEIGQKLGKKALNELAAIARAHQSEEGGFSGLIYGHQFAATIGKYVLDLELVCKVLEPEDMMHHIEYLPLD